MLFALLLLVFISGEATAASYAGPGCAGTVDNLLDSNGYFARCSVPWAMTTSAAEMASCDGSIRTIEGAYLSCSQSWRIGVSGFHMAYCPGVIGNADFGNYLTCTAPWQPFVNRPPALEAAYTAVPSTSNGNVFSLDNATTLAGATAGLLVLAWIFKLARQSMWSK